MCCKKCTKMARPRGLDKSSKEQCGASSRPHKQQHKAKAFGFCSRKPRKVFTNSFTNTSSTSLEASIHRFCSFGLWRSIETLIVRVCYDRPTSHATLPVRGFYLPHTRRNPPSVTARQTQPTVFIQSILIQHAR